VNLSEVQIDRASLLHNVAAMRTLIQSTTHLIAVVKGNAYGHGLNEVVTVLEPVVDGFQVDDMEELRRLRRCTLKRALVLGYVNLSEVEEAVSLGAELAVYDAERIPLIDAAGVRLGVRPKVHLKIDALLGRQGVTRGGLIAVLKALQGADSIDVVAAYAHFANIEDTTDLDHARLQIEFFGECFAIIRAQGFTNVGRHLSATSGLMTVEGGNSLVRLGIGTYGMYPSDPLAERFAHLDLRPAMKWVSHLAQVKVLPAGHPIGYGLTYWTEADQRIGIVPQGYSDGYDRGLSGVGEVLVGGSRRRVLGRVAMNMFAIDLSEEPTAEVEDEVVLLGAQGSERISAEEIAGRIGTINYEVTARVESSLPRVVL